MNILFLIGNGFDLNIGMKTQYRDFYKFYCQKESTSELVKELKDVIQSEIEDWADLEIELGKYTEKLKTEEDFEVVIDDIREHLSQYLELQEKEYDYSVLSQEKLFHNLCFPEEMLLKIDKDNITRYKSRWGHTAWNIDIITFNYTRVLEKILGSEKIIGKHHSGENVVLNNLHHIHGYTDLRMVLGVNDISQIKNESFRKNQNIIEALVKVECNKAAKHGVDELCENSIKDKNLICIFGLSLGETDKVWWERIGKQLREECQLILFVREKKDIPNRDNHKKIRIEREFKDKFFSKTALSDEEKERLKDKMFVAINTDMFNIRTT